MKISKFLFGIVLVVFLSLPVKADVLPLYTGIITNSAIGFVQVPKNFSLYLYPRADAEIVETVKWNNTEVRYKNTILEPYRLFAVQVANKDIAFCTVIDVNSTEGSFSKSSSTPNE